MYDVSDTEKEAFRRAEEQVVAIRTAIDLHRTDKSIPRVEAAWLDTVAPPDEDASALMMKGGVQARD